jgi:hypothetical protein
MVACEHGEQDELHHVRRVACSYDFNSHCSSFSAHEIQSDSLWIEQHKDDNGLAIATRAAIVSAQDNAITANMTVELSKG